jgi:hypothetical protein
MKIKHWQEYEYEGDDIPNEEQYKAFLKDIKNKIDPATILVVGKKYYVNTNKFHKLIKYLKTLVHLKSAKVFQKKWSVHWDSLRALFTDMGYAEWDDVEFEKFLPSMDRVINNALGNNGAMKLNKNFCRCYEETDGFGDGLTK